MSYAFLFAILSPFSWAIMNVIDKYIVHKKVKYPAGYTCVVGLANITLALIIGLFLDWSTVSVNDFLFPAIAGSSLGLAAFFYIILLESEDISHLVGLVYAYPLGVALLSFMFLQERLSTFGYIGVLLTLLGAVLLSFRVKKVSKNIVFLSIGLIVLFEVINEFFIKVSTTAIGTWHGIVVNNISLGLTLLCGLFSSKMRKHFFAEIHNIGWESISSLFALGGITTLYLAMAEIPATIVSSISSIQPLAVLFLERTISAHIGTITKDKLLIPKLIPILLIAIGVGILYLGL
ncbi:MAG: EamA family transporter [Candidatus Aenigmarchaeota archaeon]|nr:EamA family transporter [Candidatus Aenigmarchaeota archaeon]